MNDFSINVVHVAGSAEGVQRCAECGEPIGPWGKGRYFQPGRFVLMCYKDMWSETPYLQYSPWLYRPDDIPCCGIGRQGNPLFTKEETDADT